MNNTAQAILAIRLLQSLPNWDRVATVYGDIEAHLDDLVSDLENNDWNDLVIDDARLAEYKANNAWIDQVIQEIVQAA